MPAGDPAATVQRQPAARYDAVHVGMMRHRRAPGVQHQRGGDPGAEMLGIGGDGHQGLGRHVEEQPVNHGLVRVGECADWLGQGEHLGGKFPGVTRLVVGFETAYDAKRFQAAIRKRLEQFSLSLGGVRRNPRKFSYPRSSPETMSSRSILFPSASKGMAENSAVPAYNTYIKIMIYIFCFS